MDIELKKSIIQSIVDLSNKVNEVRKKGDFSEGNPMPSLICVLEIDGEIYNACLGMSDQIAASISVAMKREKDIEGCIKSSVDVFNEVQKNKK